jgi:ATP-grasp domain
MKNVLFVFPTAWDRRQLEACGAAWRDRFAVSFTAPADEDCPADFDLLDFIDRLSSANPSRVDGVTSSSDYPGAAVAAAVAAACGLPGARPEAVLRCSHKYYARLAELGPVPESLPAFALVDPQVPDASLHWVVPRGRQDAVRFPCFVKPVKGAFSVLAARVESGEALAAFVSRPCVREYTHDYLRLFEVLLDRYADWELGARYFLAEELLEGDQVTVEGFVVDGEVEILGIVDSVMVPGTRSFSRFDYPSRLPADVQARMTDIVRRVVPPLGLERTLFNVELVHDPASGRVAILEINPRMCGQFADLYQKVDGTNGYEVALQLAVGERPVIQRGLGDHRVAASFPLRVFQSTRVRRAPDLEDLRAAEAMYPGTLVWIECETGQQLANFESLEDGASARYAVVNVGASDRGALADRFDAIHARLGIELEAVRPSPGSSPATSPEVPVPVAASASI